MISIRIKGAPLVVALATTTFISTTPAWAEDTEYFSGVEQCPGGRTSTMLERGPDGDRLYRRTYFDNRTQILDVGAEENGVHPIHNGELRLEPLPEGGYRADIKMSWNDAGCEPFDLKPAGTPLEQFAQVIEATKNLAPSAAEMRAMQMAHEALPPYQLLPELDQTKLSRDEADGYSAAWKAFIAARTEHAQNAPLDTDEDRAAFVEFMRDSFDTQLAPRGFALGDPSWSKPFDVALRVAADRLAAAGGDPTELRPEGEALCANLKSIVGYPRLEMLEGMVVLPAKYWNRDISQALIDDVKSCDSNADSWIKMIADNHARLEDTAVARTWLEARIAELAALPQTFETLRETQGLSISQEELQAQSVDRALFDEIDGGRMAKHRQALADALQPQIVAALTERLKDATEDDLLYSSRICEEMIGRQRFREYDSLSRDCGAEAWRLANEIRESRMRANYEAMIAERLEAPLTLEARGQHHWMMTPRNIETGAGVLTAVPDEWAAEAERRLASRQEELIAAVSAEVLAKAGDDTLNSGERRSYCPPANIEGALGKLGQECQAAATAAEQRAELAACQDSPSVRALGRKLGEEMIRLEHQGEVQKAPLGYLACELDKQGIQVSFDKASMFSSSERRISMEFRDNPDAALNATITRGDDKVWTLNSIDNAPAALSRDGLCIAFPMKCGLDLTTRN
ncbi:hypothetical protein SAMN05421641_1323 [Paracoccus thiocyanatus]|uniref:Uncharacterized protein n=1 Tax=Paracoccus thiocyanatus TaxID=34006 RepID=A0A1N6Z8D5_9RHOB|nr:hypothetical protein [Paracoccus thiocyanatus]SIR23142.1 hypothetical protein SAMN05421641_1323 [Paracoccus thiocyanatus]